MYADSLLFVYATGILQYGVGVDSGDSVCEAAILLCLVCYVTTKVCAPAGRRFDSAATLTRSRL